MKKINILGTEYMIETHKISEDRFMKDNNFMGYCWRDERLIVIPDTTEKEYFDFDSKEAERHCVRETLRHEIVHAFLYESGLGQCSIAVDSPWAKNEEMVDWIAMQFPKILQAFKDADAL